MNYSTGIVIVSGSYPVHNIACKLKKVSFGHACTTKPRLNTILYIADRIRGENNFLTRRARAL